MTVTGECFSLISRNTVFVSIVGKERLDFEHFCFLAFLKRGSQRDAHLLEVELTETGIMDAYDSASVMLDDIRSLGVRISMDDFGVGYSSFNHLRSLPIDSLKIDRSFVRDISVDHRFESFRGLDAAIGFNLHFSPDG